MKFFRGVAVALAVLLFASVVLVAPRDVVAQEPDPSTSRDHLVTWSAGGGWHVKDPDGGVLVAGLAWGQSSETPLVGDVNGDGQDDLVVWHPPSGAWWGTDVDGTMLVAGLNWGSPGATPLLGDVDGDGRDDLIVWYGAAGNWWVVGTDGVRIVDGMTFGQSGDVPLVGDVNGDGSDDLIVWSVATGTWQASEPDGTVIVSGLQWGGYGDVPHVVDVDGDGRDDLAVWNQTTDSWYVVDVEGNVLVYGLSMGAGGDVSFIGNFDSADSGPAVLSADDAARVTAVDGVVASLEAYGDVHGTYHVYGAGRQGQGYGLLSAAGDAYPKSIMSELAEEGLIGSTTEEPTLGQGPEHGFVVRPCKDRVAVLSLADDVQPAPADAAWWAANDCVVADMFLDNKTYFSLSEPLPPQPEPPVLPVPTVRLGSVETAADGRLFAEVILEPNGAEVAGISLAATGTGLVDCVGQISCDTTDTTGHILAVNLAGGGWSQEQSVGRFYVNDPAPSIQLTLQDAVDTSGNVLAATPGSLGDNRPVIVDDSGDTTEFNQCPGSLVYLDAPEVSAGGAARQGGVVGWSWTRVGCDDSGYSVSTWDKNEAGILVKEHERMGVYHGGGAVSGEISHLAAATCAKVSARSTSIPEQNIHYVGGVLSTTVCIEVTSCGDHDFALIDIVYFDKVAVEIWDNWWCNQIKFDVNGDGEFNFGDLVAAVPIAIQQTIPAPILDALNGCWSQVQEAWDGLTNLPHFFDDLEEFNNQIAAAANATPPYLGQMVRELGIDAFLDLTHLDDLQQEGAAYTAGAIICDVAGMLIGVGIAAKVATQISRIINWKSNRLDADGHYDAINIGDFDSSGRRLDNIDNDGTKTYTNPDNSTLTVRADGTQIQRNLDDSLHITTANGTEFDVPPGRFTQCNSFPAGTQVRLANGTYKPIENIEIGDQVLSYDFDTQTWIDSYVLDQWSATHHGALATAELADGSAITATDDHRFWVESSQQWTELDETQPGSLLLTPIGTSTIVDVAVTAEHQSIVWELSVQDTHNFTVQAGPHDLLVHNADPGCGITVEIDDNGNDYLQQVDTATGTTIELYENNSVITRSVNSSGTAIVDYESPGGNVYENVFVDSGGYPMFHEGTGLPWERDGAVLAGTESTRYPLHLTSNGDGSFISAAGLHYGLDDSFGDRVNHVLNHGDDIPTRSSAHGVFTDDPVITTDVAWAKIQTGVEGVDFTFVVQGNGNTAYTVKVPEVGLEGGAGSGAALNHLLIVIKKDTTNHVVTAFPVAASVP